MNQRFLTVSTSYMSKGECWMLIGDYVWFNEHEDDIKEWCQECLTNGLVTQGMIIKFVNIEEHNLFIMRWANV